MRIGIKIEETPGPWPLERTIALLAELARA